MAKKLVFTLLCAAIAVVAARELQQASVVTVADLPKQLQELNARLATLSKDSPKPAPNLLEGAEELEEAPKKKEVKPAQYYKEEKEYYGYEKEKVTVKLYEKFRSHLRAQPGNVNTFQFTSELTCQNPKAEHGTEHEDGIIGFPIVSDRMKLVTVGVCEWTVTQVKEQRISEHATLKGNTNVVCTFTEEAERHCKNGGDVLEDGMTVSGQGLVYNFDHDQHSYYDKAEMSQAAEEPKKEVQEGEEAEGIDVYLNLINGVIGRDKELKFDNGALQYFFGPPPASYDKGRDATFLGDYKKGDPTGEYTFVFKN